MERHSIVVRVPNEDVSDLHALKTQLPNEVNIVQSRAFDGATVVQALTALTIAALPVLKAWLLARAEHRRSTTVIWEGKQLTGYSAEEVGSIVTALDQLAHGDSGNAFSSIHNLRKASSDKPISSGDSEE